MPHLVVGGHIYRHISSATFDKAQVHYDNQKLLIYFNHYPYFVALIVYIEHVKSAKGFIAICGSAVQLRKLSKHVSQFDTFQLL